MQFIKINKKMNSTNIFYPENIFITQKTLRLAIKIKKTKKIPEKYPKSP